MLSRTEVLEGILDYPELFHRGLKQVYEFVSMAPTPAQREQRRKRVLTEQEREQEGKALRQALREELPFVLLVLGIPTLLVFVALFPGMVALHMSVVSGALVLLAAIADLVVTPNTRKSLRLLLLLTLEGLVVMVAVLTR